MMDYEEFWRGFVLLFLGIPFFVGFGVGSIWAWRTGRRGFQLVFASIIGGFGFCLGAFAVAVLFFRA